MTAMAELPIKAAYIAFFSECFLILDAQPGTKALPTVVPVLCQPTLDQQVYFHNPAGGAPETENYLTPGYDEDVVASAKAVKTDLVVLGIGSPLSVHEKFVLISSGSQHYDLFPRLVFVLFHGMGFGVPSVKISHQDNPLGLGCIKREDRVAFSQERFPALNQ